MCSLCRCYVLVSVVHQVAILSVGLGVNYNLLMFGSDGSVDHVDGNVLGYGSCYDCVCCEYCFHLFSPCC